MVEAGMPTAFVLQAATAHGAELLRKTKDLGTIEAGKLADVVAVDGNPLDDIKLMQNVAFVMKDGVVYKENGKEVDFVAKAEPPASIARDEELMGY